MTKKLNLYGHDQQLSSNWKSVTLFFVNIATKTKLLLGQIFYPPKLTIEIEKCVLHRKQKR